MVSVSVKRIIRAGKKLYAHRAIVIPKIKRFIRLKKGRRLKAAFRRLIAEILHEFYDQKISFTAQGIHTFGANFGLVKNRQEIIEQALKPIDLRLVSYFKKILIRKTVSCILFYGLFAFIATPIILPRMMEMSLPGLLFFPFVYLIPVAWEALKSLIPIVKQTVLWEIFQELG